VQGWRNERTYFFSAHELWPFVNGTRHKEVVLVNNALGLIQRKKKQTHRRRKNSKLNRTCTAYKRENSAMRKDHVWTKKDVGM